MRILPLALVALLATLPAGVSAQSELVLDLTATATNPLLPTPPAGACGSGIRAYKLDSHNPNETRPTAKAYGTFSLPTYSCYTEFSITLPAPQLVHGLANLTFGISCERTTFLGGKRTLGPFPVGGNLFRASLHTGPIKAAESPIEGEARLCEAGNVLRFNTTLDVGERELGPQIVLLIGHSWLHPEPAEAQNLHFITGGADPARLSIPLGPPAELAEHLVGTGQPLGGPDPAPKDTPGPSAALVLLALTAFVSLRRRS